MYGKFYLPCRYIGDDIYEISMQPTYDGWYNTTYAQFSEALVVALEKVYGPIVNVLDFSKLGDPNQEALPFLNQSPRDKDDLGELINESYFSRY